MAIWEDFEVECTDYLKKAYGAYAKFTHKGGSDSTVPDIYVETDHGSFYIDAKHSPAQCGQFVLLPDISTGTFQYSPQNVNRINVYAKKIMEHMNKSFDEFRDAGTAFVAFSDTGNNDKGGLQRSGVLQTGESYIGQQRLQDIQIQNDGAEC